MSMWDEWQMVLMLGVAPFERMNWMADVPTCITSALISWMLYRLPPAPCSPEAEAAAAAAAAAGLELASRRLSLSSLRKLTGDRFLR